MQKSCTILLLFSLCVSVFLFGCGSGEETASSAVGESSLPAYSWNAADHLLTAPEEETSADTLQKTAPPLAPLQEELEHTLASFSGEVAVYVENLSTGESITRNDTPLYAASMIKAFVMASIYDQIEQGNLEEDSEVTRLLREMITVSDNEAYNQLVKLHSKNHSFTEGAVIINDYLAQNGYEDTLVQHTLHPSNSTYAAIGYANLVSAQDCGKLLSRIYHGECVSAEASQKMLELLLAQENVSKIPAGVPEGITVANKTGETDESQHDMAIVYGESTPYVLVILT